MITKLNYTDALNLYSLAKILKQRDYVWYKDYLFSNDDPNIIIYTRILPGVIRYYPENAMAFNTRALGAECKTPITGDCVNTIGSMGIQFTYNSSPRLTYACINNINKAIELNNIFMNVPTIDVTNEFEPIICGRKSDGAIKLNIQNHLMFIPTNVTPVKKNKCTIHMNILDDNEIFTIRLMINIQKLNSIIYQYMSFLRL